MYPPQLGRSGIRGILLALVVALPGLAGCGLREDEFRCEEVLPHLRECCPEVQFNASGCELLEEEGFSLGGPTQPPLLSSAESACLAESTCAQLRGGLCARVRARLATPRDLDAAAPTGMPVCP